MPYAYVITKDLIGDKEAKEGTNTNAKGRFRRSTLAKEQGLWPNAKAVTSDPKAEMFSLYDDDHKCYYQGYIVMSDDADGEYVFKPLEWAMANAGCTYMKMPNPKTGEMEMV